MSAKEEQLIQLLGLMARGMTHMTASITAMAFEQLYPSGQHTFLAPTPKAMVST